MANRWLYNIESKTKQNEIEDDELELLEEDVWWDFMEKGDDSKEHEKKKIPKPVSLSWPPSKPLSAWGSEGSGSSKMKLEDLKSWEQKISKKCAVERSSALVKIPERSDRRVPDDEDYDEMIPPHEYVALKTAWRRLTVVAYSMLEGMGRTLKGRDQWTFRNAVFRKTGYLD